VSCSKGAAGAGEAAHGQRSATELHARHMRARLSARAFADSQSSAHPRPPPLSAARRPALTCTPLSARPCPHPSSPPRARGRLVLLVCLSANCSTAVAVAMLSFHLSLALGNLEPSLRTCQHRKREPGDGLPM
jgi:hypothetical protein